MSLNIAGFGTSIVLVASGTYPVGFAIEALADDSDPIEIEDIEIAEEVMGVNGQTASFSKPAIIPVSISVLPTAISQQALNILFQANLVGANKSVNDDVITLTIVYPGGHGVVFTDGRMIGGPPASSLASAGRLKTMTYKFSFGGYVSA